MTLAWISRMYWVQDTSGPRATWWQVGGTFLLTPQPACRPESASDTLAVPRFPADLAAGGGWGHPVPGPGP